ncbi:MAG: hypothetical protein MHM6MM_007748 [Cercozoa sp. M6MM]
MLAPSLSTRASAIADVVGLVVLVAVSCGIGLGMPHSKRYIFGMDTASSATELMQWNSLYAHPHREEEMPVWLLLCLCAVLLVIVVLTMWARVSKRATLRVWLALTVGVVAALAVNFGATNGVKRAVGRPRPDFLWRCDYDATTHTCAGDEKVIEEGYKSFPSGHSSFASVSAMLFSLLMGTLLSKTALRSAPMMRALITMALPALFALFFVTQRVTSHWHHPSDVIAGAAIGCMSAYAGFLAWRNFCLQWLPSPAVHALGLHQGKRHHSQQQVHDVHDPELAVSYSTDSPETADPRFMV